MLLRRFAFFLFSAWVAASPAWAALDADTLKLFATDEADDKIKAIQTLGKSQDPLAAKLLKALAEDNVYLLEGGKVVIIEGDKGVNAADGAALATIPESKDQVTINNRIRKELETAQAGGALTSTDRTARLAAVKDLAKNAEASQLPALKAALTAETDPQIKTLLEAALTTASLKSDNPKERVAAIEEMGRVGNATAKTALNALLEKDKAGNYAEKDESVRNAATLALKLIQTRLSRVEIVGNLFYGISLGSVLLLAALGLAITFGLMGIINMAHGELLMIGAYATYVVQGLFKQYAPGAFDWYVVAALPVAFATAALVGMALERTVIRWLYGRPLETLLCTWGISLMLMQAVRSIFGAQNVEVANPAWLSGGVTVLGGLVLPYSRIAIIFFSLAVVFFVWMILTRTRLGLFVRAVTQNRRMADCVGVPTSRVDTLTFGLGSGIAGLGGVALSQIGNVGPDLGQAYIVDSFMVVVLGGVGQLAGTVIAAFGLGEFNKLLEPYAGAVLAKIAVLVFIIIFIQKRPQGLFALKGRAAEA